MSAQLPQFSLTNIKGWLGLGSILEVRKYYTQKWNEKPSWADKTAVEHNTPHTHTHTLALLFYSSFKSALVINLKQDITADSLTLNPFLSATSLPISHPGGHQVYDYYLTLLACHLMHSLCPAQSTIQLSLTSYLPFSPAWTTCILPLHGVSKHLLITMDSQTLGRQLLDNSHPVPVVNGSQ